MFPVGTGQQKDVLNKKNTITKNRIRAIKKLKDLIWIFWFFVDIEDVTKLVPCPPKISNHPMSIDLIMFLPRSIENLVRGCVEIGAKNHMVEKKNFILFIFFSLWSLSQAMNAKIIPEIITKIVNIFRCVGKIKGSGLNCKKMFWNAKPAINAIKLKIVVAQFTYESSSCFSWKDEPFIWPHKEQNDSRKE